MQIMNNDKVLRRENRMYTTDEVCSMLQLSKTTLWRLRKQGSLIALNYGRLVRYPANQFEQV